MKIDIFEGAPKGATLYNFVNRMFYKVENGASLCFAESCGWFPSAHADIDKLQERCIQIATEYRVQFTCGGCLFWGAWSPIHHFDKSFELDCEGGCLYDVELR
jgi:hypothetical protein